jgi:hypothetical protein
VQTACVTIPDSDGRPFTYVTAANTLFEAVAKAIEWFADPYWHGPKPQPDTIYEVSLVSDGREWQVPAEKIERWLARRARSSANLES